MRAATQALLNRFWAIPAACAAVSVLAAYGLARLDRAIGDTASAFLFPGPPEGARSFLSGVISAMISFTGLVFSITVVVLVLTSGQFSPRVLRQFMYDRVIQWSLGLFVATFLFAMTTVREVLGTSTVDSFVPRIAVTVSFLLVLVSVGMFVYYINHVIHMIQVSSVIVSIADETRALIEVRYPADPASEPADPALPARATVLPATAPGFITSVDEAALVERARNDGVVVVLALRVGDFVPAGATLMTLHGDVDSGAQTLNGYRQRVCLETERTMDQDVAFGFRQLLDIVVKALSPSVNDPTTACQGVDALHDILRRLVTRPVHAGRHADDDGAVRVIVPGYSVGDLLDVTFTELWHYGAESVQVPDRVTRALDDLRDAALPQHRDAVAAWCDRVSH